MRRWPTWLLAGALVALGAVAAADALRGSGPEARTELRPRPVPRTTVLQLREPNGVLYYSAAEDGCRLHGVGLPRLENAPPPKLRSCSFTLSPDGTAAVRGTVAWSPRGGLYARESAGMIELGSPASDESLRFPGRAPAFTPDGTFSYVKGRATVVQWTTDCPSGARLFTLPGDNATVRCPLRVLGERDLRRLLPDDPSDPITVKDLAWLEEIRLALVVELDRGASEIVGIIEEKGRVHVTPRLPGVGHTIEASPGGSFYAMWLRRTTLLDVRDRSADAIAFPSLPSVRALAWSPDDRWTAAATEFSVFLFPTNEGEATVRRLPITARDLAWR